MSNGKLVREVEYDAKISHSIESVSPSVRKAPEDSAADALMLLLFRVVLWKRDYAPIWRLHHVWSERETL